MAYSTEVIRLAREELAQKKADWESLQNQKRIEAYAKVPRLQQIDAQLRQTMTVAAQAVFMKGAEGVAAMDAVKKTNLALQAERKELVEANFPAGYLEEDALCPHCGGSGYVGSTMCGCLKALCRKYQKVQLSLLTSGEERFENFRLDYYSDKTDPNYGFSPRALMEKTLQVCKKYALDFDGTKNLLLVGNTGLGKTFLSACIANAVADRGFSVAYESAPMLFEKLNRNYFHADEESRQAADSLNGADLLIVDDLGTELTNNFTVAALYSLVNDRLLAGKSMIISTNLNVEEIAKRYSPQIASRLQGCFKALTFLGQDIRVLKSRGM